MISESSSIAFAAAAIFFSSLKKMGEIINGYKKMSSSAMTGKFVGKSL
jgi:hypothetical protein